jgi:hypothetical protein
MFRLPPQDPPLRQNFSVADLVPRRFPSFREIIVAARSVFSAEFPPVSFTAIVLRADGQVWLIECRRSGSWKRLWNFGAL